jgi:hypothetical protein
MKVFLEKSRSSKDVLIVEIKGKKHPVYSQYDPQKAAERFYLEHEGQISDYFIFIGLGLGYHVTPFIGDNRIKKIVILEPSSAIYSAVDKLESVQKIIANRKVEIHEGRQVIDFIAGIKSSYEYLFYKKIKVLSYPSLKRIFSSLYASLEEEIRGGLDALFNDGLTIGKFARIWIKNLFTNMDTSGNVNLVSSLFNRWKGNVLITGAGPSLTREIPEIQKYRGSFYLIASDSSVMPLMKSGVRPDLIVSIDPQSTVRYHFQGLEKDRVGEIPAVLSLLSYPDVFDMFKKKYLFFNLHPSSSLFDITALKMKDALLNYQSVSSYALKIALEMGFEKIVLAGLDFSYPSLRMYAADSFFYHYLMREGTRFCPFSSLEGRMLLRSSVPAGREKEQSLRLSRNLSGYRSEIEGIIQESKQERSVRFYNFCTQGMPVQGAETVESLSLGGLPKSLQERIISFPLVFNDHHKGAVFQALTVTLALRNYLYKRVNDRERAFDDARHYLHHACKRTKVGF